MTYHTTILLGNVGKDCEMRYTASGQAVSSFSVAVNEQYTNNNGESVKKTIWYRISTWGKLAETCNQYVKKGMQVLVEGRLQADDGGNPRIWGDPPHASFEISAQTVRFVGKREQREDEQPAPEIDDLPF
jgi:single-strand DNA-binding protein